MKSFTLKAVKANSITEIQTWVRAEEHSTTTITLKRHWAEASFTLLFPENNQEEKTLLQKIWLNPSDHKYPPLPDAKTQLFSTENYDCEMDNCWGHLGDQWSLVQIPESEDEIEREILKDWLEQLQNIEDEGVSYDEFLEIREFHLDEEIYEIEGGVNLSKKQ